MEMRFGPTALAGMKPSLPAQPAIIEGLEASKIMTVGYDAIEEFSGVVQSTKKLQSTFTHIEQLQELIKSDLQDRREKLQKELDQQNMPPNERQKLQQA